MKLGRITLGFFAVFTTVSTVAESIHALEPVGDAIARYAAVPTVLGDRITVVVLAALSFWICLRIARVIEVRQLVANVRWRKPANEAATDDAKPLKRFANAAIFSRNAGAFGAFVLMLPLAQIVIRLSTVVNAAEALVRWSGPFGRLVAHLWEPAVLTLFVAVSLALSKWWWRRRLQDVALPSDDETGLGALIDHEALTFRLVRDDPADPAHTAALLDIRQLAATETYGAMGETNVKQVFEWWKAYPRGNWLADHRGRVVGGVDIWPIRKAMYVGLRDGTKGEEDLDADSIAPRPDSDDGSYWYVGSISIALRLRQSRYRRAVLARLLETMLLDNFIPAKPAYPVHIIALIWTQQGENIAARSGFRFVSKRVSDEHDAAEPIYELVFDDEAAIRAMLDRIRARLASQPPVENPGYSVMPPSTNSVAPVT